MDPAVLLQMWERLQKAKLSGHRRQDFLSRAEIATLTKYSSADLVAAANAVMSANPRRSLLLTEWAAECHRRGADGFPEAKPRSRAETSYERDRRERADRVRGSRIAAELARRERFLTTALSIIATAPDGLRKAEHLARRENPAATTTDTFGPHGDSAEGHVGPSACDHAAVTMRPEIGLAVERYDNRAA